MKKSKVLIGTLALATALMGTGYAWWTETVTVTSTVNTSELNIAPSAVTLQVQKQDSKQMEDAAEGKATVNAADDTVTLTIDKMYPDSYAHAKITFKNIGEVAGKLGEVKVIEADSEFARHLEIKVGNAQTYQLLSSGTADLSNQIAWKPPVKKDGTVDVDVWIHMPANEGDKTGKQYESSYDPGATPAPVSGTITMKFNWDQFNYTPSATAPTE